MKGLSAYLDEYLELRHKLGFRLRLAGGLLRRFVRFAALCPPYFFGFD